MGADIALRGETAAERLRHDRGLQTAEANARVRRALRRGAYGVGKRRAVAEVLAVGGNFDPCDDDLAEALSGEPGALRGDIGERQAAHPAAGVRDDAVGAEIVAAVLDLEVSAGSALQRAGGEMLDREPPEGVVHALLPAPLRDGGLHRLDELRTVAAAENDVRAERGGLLRLDLGEATADGGDRAGVFGEQPPHGLARLAPALRRNGAGVDDHGVGVARVGRRVAVGEQNRLHRLRLKLVDLAAQRCKNVFHGKNVLVSSEDLV